MGVSEAEEFREDGDCSVFGVLQDEVDFSALRVFREHVDFSDGTLWDDVDF